MARVIGAGVAELHIITTIAILTAPTAAELNAGVDVTNYLPDGGLSTPFDGSIVDIADMSSKFNKTAAGTFGGQPLSMEMFRDDAIDTAWTTLVRGFVGFAAIARFALATAGTWAISDIVDVWPIEVITRNPADLVRNEAQRFTSESAVTEVPTEDFVIAA